MALGCVGSSEKRLSKTRSLRRGFIPCQLSPMFSFLAGISLVPRRASGSGQSQGHLAKPRPHLVSMGMEEKSRLGLTTMMKIYLGSKSRKKPQTWRVVKGQAVGREN